jgi:filamin
VKYSEGDFLDVKCERVNTTTYECRYTPKREGPHQVNISFANTNIPKSTFNVEVGPYKESYKKAYGPGLVGGVVGYSADFIVETDFILSLNRESLKGVLTFAIDGPSQARIEYIDNLDGSTNVKYWPIDVGEYAIHVLCDGEDIPNSPYMACIKSRGDFDPTKVKAFLPSVDQNQLIVGKPVELIVDCSVAGDANLKVTVIDANYKKVMITGINNKNGTYTCRFTPISPNKHIVFVTYGSVCIPNFPAKVIKSLFLN